MALIKSLGNTFFFILLLNLISCWILIGNFIEMESLILIYSFFTPFMSLFIVLIYLGLLKNSEFLTVSETATKFYIWGAILGVVCVFMQIPLNWIYNDLFNTTYYIDIRFRPVDLLKASSFASVLIVPVYEEFFFRKFIQRDLQKTFHPILAILFASILFAIIHLPFHFLLYDDLVFNFHHAYITFFGGLILGILYYKSKSIGPSIILHGFWNLCVYLF